MIYINPFEVFGFWEKLDRSIVLDGQNYGQAIDVAKDPSVQARIWVGLVYSQMWFGPSYVF